MAHIHILTFKTDDILDTCISMDVVHKKTEIKTTTNTFHLSTFRPFPRS